MKWGFIVVNAVISVKMTSIFRRFGLLSQKMQSCVFFSHVFIQLLIFGLLRANGSQLATCFVLFVITNE